MGFNGRLCDLKFCYLISIKYSRYDWPPLLVRQSLSQILMSPVYILMLYIMLFESNMFLVAVENVCVES